MLFRFGRRIAVAVGAVCAVEGIRFSLLERSETHSTETALTQFFLFDALRVVSVFARRQHDSDCAAFDKVQAELLRSRLAANVNTAYGRDHGFEQLLQISGSAEFVTAFRSSQPLTFASDYVPYVQRIAAGEAAVVNAEGETMLAATSGTSGRRNIIPNTATMSSTFFTRGILVVFDTLLQSVPEAFTLQRTCKLAFAPTLDTTEGGLRVGANSSGPNDKSFKRLLPLYSTPEEGYSIAHDEFAALYVHALFAARDRKLGIVEANFASMPFRLFSLLHRDGLRIAADIASGTIDADVASRLDPTTRVALEQHLGGPNPARGAEVRAAVLGPSGGDASARVGLARRLWPDLKLILANGTGAFEAYAQKLRSGEGEGVPVLSTVLAASEGLMGVSLAGAGQGGEFSPRADGEAVFCLVPRAMFFEFKPLEAAEAEAARGGGSMVGGTLLARECEVGEEYELVVSNLGGLCRYRIGDVVRLEGFHGGAPLVRFQYRLGQLLNLRGEKLTEPQFQRSLLRIASLRVAPLVARPSPPQHGSEPLPDASSCNSNQPGGLNSKPPASGPPLMEVAEYVVEEHTESEPPHYRVYVEPAAAQAPASSESELSAQLDQALRETSDVYAAWRRRGGIGPPEIRVVHPGAISEELRARRLAEGASPQQLKVSRVLRQRAHAELLRARVVGRA